MWFLHTCMSRAYLYKDRSSSINFCVWVVWFFFPLNSFSNVVQLKYTDDPDVARPSQKDSSDEKHQLVEELFAALERGENATGQSYHTQQAGVSAEQAPTREGLSREFILSCALSPVARQRPVNISLDRTEDWVREIVLGDVSRQRILEYRTFVFWTT